MEKNLRLFETKIGVAVALAKQQGHQWSVGEEIEIRENGMLAVPSGVNPLGFYLVLYTPTQPRVIITQRDLTYHHGDYRDPKYDYLENVLGEDWIMNSFNLPIPVERQGGHVWTAWKGRPAWKKPAGMSGNKVDCWIADREGHLDLFQTGIITPNDGQSWHLLGEYRWRGKLFRSNGTIVGKPKKPAWGAFGVRQEILEHPEFKDHLRKIRLSVWQGNEKELSPLLDPVPQIGYARVQWYSPFAGKTGQGPVKLYDGSAGWIHGIDIMSPPDGDGIQRLQRNDLIRYTGTTDFGSSKENIRLLCVEKVL